MNMAYTLRFFPSRCSLFHNFNLFGPVLFTILYTGCAEIKKKQFRRQNVKEDNECTLSSKGYKMAPSKYIR